MPGEARTRITGGTVGSNQLSQLLTDIFSFLKSWHLGKNRAGTSVLLLRVCCSIPKFDREDAHLISKTLHQFVCIFNTNLPLAELES